MASNPEIKGVPDPIDKTPRKEPSEATIRGIGQTAVKGS